nr:uncharacterized protein LOC122269454 [Parasteatoda tepidariorum]
MQVPNSLPNSLPPAELTAIKLAITWANAENIKAFNLFSDSKSSLQSLENPNPNDPLVEEIRNMVKYKTCCLNWVKAHSGDIGNEEADALAKQGTLLGRVDHYYPLSKPQINYRLRQSVAQNMSAIIINSHENLSTIILKAT